MDRHYEIFVPGRLCLFGEHSDWAGQYRRNNSEIEQGSAIVTGTDQGIYARAVKHDKLKIRSVMPNGEEVIFESEADYATLLSHAKNGGFFSYICGVAAYMTVHYNVGGLFIDCYKMLLPIKKGLSSSAAVCVLSARAFNQVYGLHLSLRGEMDIAYRGEILTPSRCGRMDQACAFGSKPINMTFDGDSIDVEQLTVKKDVHIVFADLNAGKDTKGILNDLNKCYPFVRDEKDKNVHAALGSMNLDITNRVKRAFAEGNIEEIGRLMTEAQEVFDRYVAPMSKHLTSPKLHEVLADEGIKSKVYGGKGVGSQGDGCIQFVARNEEAQRELIGYLTERFGMTGYPLTIKKQRLVKKAVIPAAGYGTRMFPMTKILSKPLLPVQDSDGLIKPALLILTEELIRQGFEKICIIVRANELRMYESLFERMDPTHYASLPIKMKEYEDKLGEMRGKIEFMLQNEQLGFGHAVYLTKEFACGDPVLLLLGDYLYKQTGESHPFEKVVSIYEKTQELTFSIMKIEESETDKCGLLYGSWEDAEKTVLNIENMYEKPGITIAREHFLMNDANNNPAYYAFGGAYILNPKIYTLLETLIENKQHTENGSEIQLTTALKQAIKDSAAQGVLTGCEVYDIGNPDAYTRTIEYRAAR